MPKGRDSGMPSKDYWETFFDPGCVLPKLDCDGNLRDVIEFGCGYGSFTEAAARIVSGTVYAIDIEQAMIDATASRINATGLSNVHVELRDFTVTGSGRPNASIDYVMLFNILHIEAPVALLREAYRTLVPGGLAAIIHWKHDPTTPRGPSLEIRPRPEQCERWSKEAGFEFVRHVALDCCSYHYGLLVRRPSFPDSNRAN